MEPSERTRQTIASARRLCFFAHYHAHGIVAEHVLIYLRALGHAGFIVVVVSTATLDAGEQNKLREVSAALVMRENHGLDFGGWVEAVRLFFPISAELLLLANDSVYAPVGDLSAFVERLVSVPADFYGIIETLEIAPHYQSWFLLLRPSAYRSAAFDELLGRPIPPELSKDAVIERYEVGVTRALRAVGLKGHAAYRPADHGAIAARLAFNPGHLLWRELVEQLEIPFLKIDLLRFNGNAITNLPRWRAVVGARSPELLDAIEQDLWLRGDRGRADIRPSWRSSLSAWHPPHWPEVQLMLRRDFRTGRMGFARHVSATCFHLVEGLGRGIRKLAKRM